MADPEHGPARHAGGARVRGAREVGQLRARQRAAATANDAQRPQDLRGQIVPQAQRAPTTRRDQQRAVRLLLERPGPERQAAGAQLTAGLHPKIGGATPHLQVICQRLHGHAAAREGDGAAPGNGGGHDGQRGRAVGRKLKRDSARPDRHDLVVAAGEACKEVFVRPKIEALGRHGRSPKFARRVEGVGRVPQEQLDVAAVRCAVPLREQRVVPRVLPRKGARKAGVRKNRGRDLEPQRVLHEDLERTPVASTCASASVNPPSNR